ncbi:hypothetical protein BC937DRAFT_90775 [Endogone sp. FLAS-F59071]|nr:hypothetical protein BC937DRAFT_90775 [Endogone sp. FLAS-F59071]|eukprot:RUS23191.1 hypothetical protein BC937DRAFT_90775 [Endogone sp. FLAS-F59071]
MRFRLRQTAPPSITITDPLPSQPRPARRSFIMPSLSPRSATGNRLSQSVNNNQAPFRIELLLNASFEQDDEPVYCPGSVIQGIVHLKLEEPIKAQGLKLVFKGDENMDEDNNTFPGLNPIPDRYFAIRTFLWGSGDEKLSRDQFEELSAGEHAFPFTIELPLINYCPTFNNGLFRSTMVLHASVERSYRFPPVSRQVFFQPFVETRTPKLPIVQELSTTGFAVEAEFMSQAYRPGDLITIHFHLASVPRSPVAEIKITLVCHTQISYNTFHHANDSIVQRVQVATQLEDPTEPLTLQFRVPSTAVPTVTEGSHLRVSYLLRLQVKSVGKYRPYKTKLDVPVTVGTLPNDIPVPADLKPYVKEVKEGPRLERPRFLAQIEHEAPLPIYEEHNRPPSYNDLMGLS